MRSRSVASRAVQGRQHRSVEKSFTKGEGTFPLPAHLTSKARSGVSGSAMLHLALLKKLSDDGAVLTR